jgi:hypothetical protein
VLYKFKEEIMLKRIKSPYLPTIAVSKTECQQQIQLMMRLFEHWKLNVEQQRILLGLPPNLEKRTNNYVILAQCVPKCRDIQDRICHLLNIHKLLSRAYVFHKELAYSWMTTDNADFEYKRPLDIIVKEGLVGLVKVRIYLELKQSVSKTYMTADHLI